MQQMIKITDLIVPLDYDLTLLEKMTCQKLQIDPERLLKATLLKRSVDFGDPADLCFKITLGVFVSGEETEIVYRLKDKKVRLETETFYTIPTVPRMDTRPIIVGCGPAGLFAALILAQAGTRPILLERGLDVVRRKEKVLRFWQKGILDPDTNVQFGEGGAGTFSDGKLKIGSKDPVRMKILDEFVEAGAPPEILYEEKPHIGTDRLGIVVSEIRNKIIRYGGEVLFNTTLTKLLQKNGRITGLGVMSNGEYTEMDTEQVILAIGHSARDTFEMLYESGVRLEQRPIAVGVRIEHPQELINRIRYGQFAGNKILGAADYRMVVHLPNGRGVYTFCMCPGGTVVSATSEKQTIVTNGMSEYLRNGQNANTALLVTVRPDETGSSHPLAGMEYQRRIEQAAFHAGGDQCLAPVQRLEDFLHYRETNRFGDVFPTFQPGTAFSRVDSYLPGDIAESLRRGIAEMGDWMPGFLYPDALLTGAETRSSSPVRILRDDRTEAVGLKGLYPCGEGAGYAGGIISAAADGIRCAEHLLENTGARKLNL